MKETFFQPFSDDLSKVWQNVLDLQAKLFGPKVIKYFSQFGLSESSGPLLDLGCGTGAYTLILKNKCPLLKIVAADANDELLETFRGKLQNEDNPDIQTIQWKAGHESVPNIIRECSSASLRLVLQHIKNPTKVLSILKETLKPGSKIYIVEEDDGFFQIYPENRGFQRIFKSWSDYEDHNLNSRYTGRQLPHFAKKAGLNVLHFDVLFHTQQEVGLQNIANYYLSTYHLVSLACPNLISKEDVESVSKDIEEYIANQNESCFLFYPQVVMIAEVPK